MLMKFTKMHGLGNDFVVIDAVTQNVRVTASMARRLGNRTLGIGCDQILVVEPPSDPSIDFNYRIFNADGGEVEQCGNGARCLARFVKDRRLTGKSTIRVKTMNRVMELRINADNLVSVDMGIPALAPAEIPFQADESANLYAIDIGGNRYQIAAISMGNPHGILQVDDVQTAPVSELGPQLECHERFPNRVNAGFMQVIDRQQLKVRVFERGAGETQACGSGACAAAVAAIQQELVDSPVTVHLTGGDLTIDWQGEGQPLIMTGPAVTVFHGRIRI
ncbi:diaminopimelate epimerase [bacterium]|jgi:diaminopimelate epimerase|nr:diaminopimelate epimerase [Porticoccaceae bacterium]MDA9352655.1 diaminopimelate epimerase [Porticoccaceae bacterium]MDB4076263.1 diaminopimelate epimerase [Porticoccaceae bacterium]MDB9724721.1 diaminopimelate epimerase [bacterium]MDB9952919.1 diaminopimelate epimerase [Porticoccaceae bacterium]